MQNQSEIQKNILRVRGARAHNLRGIDVDIPKDELIVITGLSGSGKSSLAFDTIYAEGQRRYVESLSSYARQFLGLMEKPDVDLIEGLSPAISIDQKSASHNPRSTVGTVTEIYDYLRLLYARVGHPRSPVTGKRLEKQNVQQIVDSILRYPERFGTDEVKLQLLAPVVKNRKGTYEELFQRFLAQGYVRVRVDGQAFNLDEEITLDRYKTHTIELIVDRLTVSPDKSADQDFVKRLTDSVELALNIGDRELLVNVIHEGEHSEDIFYSEKLVDPETGESFPEVEPHTFSFNSPHGACERCSGLGTIKEIDPANIYNPRLTISEGAIYPWSRMADNSDSWHMQLLAKVAEEEGFSLKAAMGELPEKDLKTVLYGAGERKFSVSGYEVRFEGVIPNLLRRYQQTESEFIRREIEEYMNELECPVCGGKRLRREALAVTIRGQNIVEVTSMSIRQTADWIDALAGDERIPESAEDHDYLSNQEKEIAVQIFKEIGSRLNFLLAVGLDYLTLSRQARTLSGGEAQRIRLASQIGSGLSGVLYVLDEPSIGLHQRDNERLIGTLRNLRDLGNTVLVVEHDLDTMQAADHLLDIGPGAGEHGGEVVAQGSIGDIISSKRSITGQYLSGEKVITRETITAELREIGIDPEDTSDTLKRAAGSIELRGVRHHNLKNIDVEFPLAKLVCVTGVSGSGKSSLVNEVLYPILAADLNGARTNPGKYDQIRGIEHLDKVIDIDQSPIGRTPRSNPATYTGVFSPVRDIFASTREAKTRGYKSGRFSFNVRGGRCENCQGDGVIRIEMQFLPDVYVTCEECGGRRYNRETLQIDYKGKSIADVLDMTVEEALEFFTNVTSISNKLQTLVDVGLGYIRMGQSATTLSGGEAQRVKLASELSKRQTGRTLYILDEPTTGLHFEDVRKLLLVLHGLVAKGNSVIVIEHNLDVIKTADWVIDLGPEGGDAGGTLLAEGTPAQIAYVPESYTGQWLSKTI